MPSAKLAAAIVLSALSLSACGISAKPEAGTPKAIANGHKGSMTRAPSTPTCLEQARIAFHNEQLTVGGKALPSFQVDTAPTGPTVIFEATPGDAQGVQIQGEAQGAEVIGRALVSAPQPAPGRPAQAVVEGCVAKGGQG